jgi:hypothetical protein
VRCRRCRSIGFKGAFIEKEFKIVLYLNNRSFFKKMRFTFCLTFLCCSVLFSDAKSSLGDNPAFVENKGQILNQNLEDNKEVLYMYTGKGLKIQLRKTGYSYELFSIQNTPVFSREKKGATDPAELLKTKIFTARVDIDFQNLNENTQVIAEEKNKELLNYFTCGKEASNVASFKKVTYKNIYPNIDIEFTLNGSDENPLKYNIILHPGANLNDIKFICRGAKDVQLQKNILGINTGLGKINEKIPFSFYSDELTADQNFKFNLNNNVISFSGNYDNKKTLVIDPSSNIIWGTYFGGSAMEYSGGVGVDAQNNAYVVGHTLSTSNIATNGVYQTTLNGNFDVYIAKFDPNGSLTWGTYFGGSSYETCYCVYVQPNGDIYVGGNTGSAANVASIGAHQTVYGGGIDDAILLKFDTNGQRLWSTYYGADQHDIAYSVTVDNSANVIICGHTESSNIANSIASPGSFKQFFSFGVDAFVAKFSSNGSRLWGTYYGDTGTEEAWGVACDPANNVYITGFTNSVMNISTGGCHQQFTNGGIEAFIAKFDPNGTSLIWGTYYGGSADEQGAVIAVSPSGNVFVGGNAGSSNFISTPGTYQISPGSSEDVFVACFTASGVRQWCTYYGGNGSDYVYDMLLDAQDNIFICGQTLSTNSISAVYPYQATIGLINTYDGYFAKLSPAGNKLLFGTYFGSTGVDAAKGIALDNTNKLYLAGETNSPAGLTTPGSYMQNPGGSNDAFLAKFCLPPKPTIVSPAFSPTICTNDNYPLTANNNYSNYIWSNGTPGNPLIIGPLSPGNYYFKVTADDILGCTGTSDSLLVIVNNCITGLNEENELNSIKISPIPTKDLLIIENIFSIENEKINAEIISSTGQLIRAAEIKIGNSKLNVSDLPDGIYFLRVISGSCISTKKFVKN